MNLLFLEDAWEDYLYWQKINIKNLKRVNELIKATLRDPYYGIGKPEPLKFDMSGCFSRRIDAEHRLVYKVEDDNLIIIQCRYHY
ncbi:Toxin YoeB [Candidatus Arcanobacter lacustris]|uniref:Putative mRNA interferase YoeB n=1 Tax=Candidatus Arcanibacter lacustris TaxID=1607817 RepID=A0A0F5MQX3_9RICK|nr:Toxin YoeB [Candidatus Arcanobacter lacustris]